VREALIEIYIGLTPRELFSDEHVYKRRISDQGNSIATSYLIESTWFLI